MPIDAANQLLSHPRRLHRAMVPSHRDRDDDGVEERGDKLQRGSSSGDRHLKLRTHDSEKEVARRYFLDSRPGLESLEARMRGIRSRDFQRLDSEKCVYLDYTGAMLAPSTLVRDHTSVLQTAILGNPHSVNAPSAVSSEHDHGARTAVLRMTRASSHDYTVIWTLNASGALKTVAEAYPFGPQGRILYAPDCHNSVLGITLYARSKGASSSCFSFAKDSLCWDLDDLRAQLKRGGHGPGWLLVLPGQSNASGIKHPIKDCVAMAKSMGWDVLLDAAALAPSGGLDLGDVSPDFVTLSFYKIFGYPTGIGALVARKASLSKLSKPWFGGGTVQVVTDPRNSSFQPIMHDAESHEHWEDGTINFQQTIAVSMGVEWITNIGLQDVADHTDALSAWLSAAIKSLRWRNGAPLALFPPVDGMGSRQGSAISFMPLLDDGSVIPAGIIEEMANKRGIAVRTGCFCNPGTGFKYHELYTGHSAPAIDHHSSEDIRRLIDGKAVMALVRSSVGIPTNFDDVWAFYTFLRDQILPNSHRIKAQVEAFKSKSSDNASSSGQLPSESDDGGIDQSGFGRYDVPVLNLEGRKGFDSVHRPEHGGRSSSYRDTSSSRVLLKSRGGETGSRSRDHKLVLPQIRRSRSDEHAQDKPQGHYQTWKIGRSLSSDAPGSLSGRGYSPNRSSLESHGQGRDYFAGVSSQKSLERLQSSLDDLKVLLEARAHAAWLPDTARTSKNNGSSNGVSPLSAWSQFTRGGPSPRITHARPGGGV